jgi:LPS-assembly lipoprotein
MRVSDGAPVSAASGVSRRVALRGAIGLLALGAGGCGFRPLYGGGSAGAGGDDSIAAELAATRVALIPDRFGQLMRRGLQQRLGSGRDGQTARYELLVGPSFATEGLGVQRDGSATRVRYVATANWTLLRLEPRETVANGFERAIEAFNIQPNQFFAADTSRDATERRLAESLAEEVVVRLAVQFRNLRDGTAAQRIEPVPTPPTLPEPAPPLGSSGLLAPPPGSGLEGGPSGGIGPLGLPR